MNAKLFFDNFAHLADSPDGIAKLRQLILQLAIQGKLVPQNPTDEPAAILLERIKAERERLISHGKIKRQKLLSESEANDSLFLLPNTWQWSRLGELCSVQTGRKDANEGSISGKFNFYTCAKEPIKSDSYSFEGEAIILPGNGANVGHVNYVNEKFEAYQRTYVLNSFIHLDVNFVALLLKSLWNDNLGKQYGSAINYIRFYSGKVGEDDVK